MNEAHECYQLSVRTIKACGNSISLPMNLIFKSTINEGVLLEDWKKSNILPIRKKNKKISLSINRPISLLSIFSKVFERLVFNGFFNFFLKNKLSTLCQSGFIPGDSCVSKLLSITHKVYQSFVCNLHIDTRGAFLDIPKAFDNV